MTTNLSIAECNKIITAPQSTISPLRYDISSLLPTIEKIARRYTLPPKCAITHDDLIQEALLALLEHSAADGNLSLAPSVAEGERVPTGGKGASIYAIARRAIQQSIARYVSPVTRSLDTELYTDDNGDPITLADTIEDAATLTPEQLLFSLQDAHILRQTLATLTPREQIVLTRLYGLDGKEPVTTEALATALAVSHWAVHKLRERSLRKLQKNARIVSNFRPKPVYI